MQASFFLDLLVSFEDFFSESCPQAYLALQHISSHAFGSVRGQHSYELHFVPLRRISYKIYTAEDASMVAIADVQPDLAGALSSHNLDVARRNRRQFFDSSSERNQLRSDQTTEELAEIGSDGLHASLEVHDQHCIIFVQLDYSIHIFQENFCLSRRQLLMNGRQRNFQGDLLMVAQISKLSCSLAAILLLLFPSVQGLNFPYSFAIECRVGDNALQLRELATIGPFDQPKDGIDLLINVVGVLIGVLYEYILRQRLLVLFLPDGAIDDRREDVHVDTELGVVQQLALLDGFEALGEIWVGGGLFVHLLDGVVGLEVVEVVQDVAVKHCYKRKYYYK